jgi:hypothetical protein
VRLGFARARAFAAAFSQSENSESKKVAFWRGTKRQKTLSKCGEARTLRRRVFNPETRLGFVRLQAQNLRRRAGKRSLREGHERLQQLFGGAKIANANAGRPEKTLIRRWLFR